MTNSKVKFLGGAGKASDMDRLPLGEYPRVALAGRSNVGKSSLFNSLTQSKMARVSAEPGKTRELNFFLWEAFGKKIVLVDLPGYGYAKVSQKLRRQWGDEIAQWMREDPLLQLVVCLVDGRLGYMPQDVELVEYLQEGNRPFVVAFTKMDKWKSANQRRKAEKDLADLSKKLNVDNFIYVSSHLSDGVQPLKQVLKNTVL